MAKDWRRVARRAALRYQIDPNIFLRQIGAESGFNPNAISPAGAIGIAQIMPATAAGWHVNPRNPRASLFAAAKAMSGYLRSYRGDWRLALAAYNAGPGSVAQYHGVPPYSETQNYVKNILQGMPHWNKPSNWKVAPGAGQRPQHPQNLGALVSALARQGGMGQAAVSPKQLHAQLLSQPGATPTVGTLTPNVLSATGVPTNELYSQIQQLRRQLLSA